MSYNKYPKEMKEAIIARMLEGDETVTVTDIQRDTGVGINTLYRWRDQAKHQKGLSATTKYKNADKWSSQDKFMVVLETANLTEIEFSEYCREKGVYPDLVIGILYIYLGLEKMLRYLFFVFIEKYEMRAYKNE